DATKKTVIAEHAIGGVLSDLVTVPGNDRHLLATDEEGHRLLLLKRDGSSLSVAARLDVTPYPVTVRVTADGRTIFVASLWSRQLSVVRLDPGSDSTSPALTLERAIPLPFAPREQVWNAKANRLIVTDSFGGRIAIVDPTAGAVESVRTLPAHNIRGLGLSS